MPFQINTEITTKDGLVVPSGSYATMQIFISQKRELTVELLLYLNKNACDNGKSPIQVTEAQQVRFKKTLTLNEYANITALQIHQYLEAVLEGILGANTVAIVQ